MVNSSVDNKIDILHESSLVMIMMHTFFDICKIYQYFKTITGFTEVEVNSTWLITSELAN